MFVFRILIIYVLGIVEPKKTWNSFYVQLQLNGQCTRNKDARAFVIRIIKWPSVNWSIGLKCTGVRTRICSGFFGMSARKSEIKKKWIQKISRTCFTMNFNGTKRPTNSVFNRLQLLGWMFILTLSRTDYKFHALMEKMLTPVEEHHKS